MTQPFTVFCYGTDEVHETKEGGQPTKLNIISSFSRAAGAVPVGSKKPEHANRSSIYLNGPVTKASDPTGITQVKKHVALITNDIIDWLQRTTPDENGSYQINMLGNSRGAVTCNRVAFALSQMQVDGDGYLFDPDKNKRPPALLRDSQNRPILRSKVIFNIFQSDPVAGLTDKRGIDARVVSENVRHHAATVYMHEMRVDFTPQDITRILVQNFSSTYSAFSPTFGNHTDPTKIKNKQLSDSAIITWNKINTFLTGHGTHFQSTPNIVRVNQQGIDQFEPWQPVNSTQLLEHFAEEKNNIEHYERSGRGYRLGLEGTPFLARSKRRILKNIDDYVQGAAHFKNGKLRRGIFIDQHERELCKENYPIAFNYFLERGLLDPGDHDTGFNTNYRSSDVINELRKMQKQNPKFFEFFRTAFDIHVSQSSSLEDANPLSIEIPNAPRGEARIENFHYTTALEGRDVILNSTEILEKEILQSLYIYQREKSEWMAASKRSEHDLAIQIKNEVRYIMNSNRPDQKKALLNCLERHCLDLKSIDSPSKLLVSFERILKKNHRQFQPEKRNFILSGVNHLFALPGKGVRVLGQAIARLGRIASLTGFGLGSIPEAFGRRFFNDPADLYIGNKTWGAAILGLVPKAIGYFFQGVGKLIKNIFKIPELIGLAIKNTGNHMIHQSGAYSGSFTSSIPDAEVIAKPASSQLNKQVAPKKYTHGTEANVSHDLHIHPSTMRTSVSVKPHQVAANQNTQTVDKNQKLSPDEEDRRNLSNSNRPH